MRRGLMAWNADEIPVDVLRQRVQRLQTAMANAGQDAMIVYTNFIRSAAVSHLTAFSPYWADGVLLVPREGEPLFATTLSKRVGSWIQTVKPIGDLVNSPTPGKILGERLAAVANIRRVAVLELDAFPSGLYDELATALPGVEIVDGSEVFAAARGGTDDTERSLLEHADVIAWNALENLRDEIPHDAGSAVGAVEKHTRMNGAEEAYIAIAPDIDADRRFIRLSGNQPLGRRFAIRATVAYKGAWIRRVKTYVRDERDRFAIALADKWFLDVVASIDAKRGLGEQLAAAVALLPNAQLVDWMAEAAVGTRPLAVIESPQMPGERAARVLTVWLMVDGVPWCQAGLTRWEA